MAVDVFFERSFVHNCQYNQKQVFWQDKFYLTQFYFELYNAIILRKQLTQEDLTAWEAQCYYEMID